MYVFVNCPPKNSCSVFNDLRGHGGYSWKDEGFWCNCIIKSLYINQLHKLILINHMERKKERMRSRSKKITKKLITNLNW